MIFCRAMGRATREKTSKLSWRRWRDHSQKALGPVFQYFPQGMCYGLNASVEIQPTKAVVLGGRAFGGCLGHEGGALVKGISALRNSKRYSRAWSFSLLLISYGYKEKTAVCKPETGPSPSIKGATLWSWTFLPPTLRVQCLLTKPPCLWCSVIAARAS